MATLRTAVIKKCREQDHDDRPASEQRWCLYTHDGKKLLGRHPSKESALKQERAIQVHKHGEAAPSVVKYKGAYYHSVQALQEDIDPSARISRSEKWKKWWESLSEEERSEIAKKRSEGHKKWWENLSEEELAEVAKKQSEGQKRRWENISEEERAEIAKKQTERMKRWWESLSEEELAERRKKQSEGSKRRWENLSEEELAEVAKKQSEGQKRRWENLSEEERHEIAKKQTEGRKRRWESLSEEERAERRKKQSERQKRWWENLSEKNKDKKAKDIIRQRIIERKQGKKPSVVKYKGAYYHSVQALQEDIDPSARISRSDYYVSAKIQLTNMDIWLQRAEKIFDALVAAPEMEKYDDKRQAIDDNITKARKALKAVESLTNRMGDKLEKQSETIKRFQKALEELQSQRAASVQRVNEKMARQEKSPEMVKYAGHFYVLAEDEAPEEEKEEKEEEEEVEEETEEMDLLDALKGYWQTILDKLPDDLEVDEDFEAALTGIDDVIAVMEKIHEEYEEPEGEEGSEEESEGE